MGGGVNSFYNSNFKIVCFLYFRRCIRPCRYWCNVELTFPPLQYLGAVCGVLDDASVTVAVGHKEVSGAEHGHRARLAEMFVVIAGDESGRDLSVTFFLLVKREI